MAESCGHPRAMAACQGGRCRFAVDRFDPRRRRSVTLEEARDVIDIAIKNHIGYLLFVGGEPLVHRDLHAMTRYAAERGIEHRPQLYIFPDESLEHFPKI